jgi:ParB family chromosome partitioning protein
MPYDLDPATCHPRYPAQSRLVPSLYTSIKTHSQITPAIVRPIPANPDSPDSPQHYEIICGHRRYAAILHLNSQGHNVPFVANILDITDEQAFRVADIDNRERSDISDYQRAVTYAEALATHYDNNQTAMAKSLNLGTATVSRYLALAGLPEPILKAFYDQDAIRISDAATLAPLLRSPETAGRVLAKAKSLASKQGIRRINSQKRLAADTILRQLKETAETAAPTTARHAIRNPAGILIVSGHHTKTGRLALTLTSNPNVALHEKLTAAAQLITTLSG